MWESNKGEVRRKVWERKAKVRKRCGAVGEREKKRENERIRR